MKTTWFNILSQIDAILASQAKQEINMSELSDKITQVSADLDTLGAKLDTETAEIAKVIALLQTANPDVPNAITALKGIHTRVGTLSDAVDKHVTTLDAALPPP
jgi:uncharacterized coiled-coil protein SlyX